MNRLAALAVIVLCSCGIDDASVRSDDPSGQADQALCSYKCQKCPPNQVCAMLCVAKGNCGNTCTETQLCIQGYSWDTRSCSCQPTRGGPATNCGPSLTCHGQEHCCTGPGPVSIDPTQNSYFCSTGPCPL